MKLIILLIIITIIKSCYTTIQNNISVLIGDNVYLNCSILTPTWLKASVMNYDQNGLINNYLTETIIVTRKGVIQNSLENKLKILNDKTLLILNVNIYDEGKYICKGFQNQEFIYYLNVYAYLTGLQLKYEKLLPSITNNNNNNNDRLFIKSDQIQTHENNEIKLNCTVHSSKPSVDLSIWLVSSNEDRRIDISDYHVTKNKDLTLKSQVFAKVKLDRTDNLKYIKCVAENHYLNEKWESKRLVNVYYPPICSKNQKLIYHTGINQSVDIQCQMSDSNPTDLEFKWSTVNGKIRSNGQLSTLTIKPQSEYDFGEIQCQAWNSINSATCRYQLVLGGPPNPPENCHFKENNVTIIIECDPGFNQGDPEVYYYLMKKKSNGILLEYTRKRDSCSFLVSNTILEYYLNEFYIYSSNKYGNNKDSAVKLIIENKHILNKKDKNNKELLQSSLDIPKNLFIIIGTIGLIVLITFMCCCMCMKYVNTKQKNRSLQFNENDDDEDDNDGKYNQKKLSLYEDNERLYSSIRRNKSNGQIDNNTLNTSANIQLLESSPKIKKYSYDSSDYDFDFNPMDLTSSPAFKEHELKTFSGSLRKPKESNNYYETLSKTKDQSQFGILV